MYGKPTRQRMQCVLDPNHWAVIFEREEDIGDVNSGFQNVNLVVQAEGENTANAVIAIRDSNDNGATWTTRYTHAQALRPGGFVDMNTHHVGTKVQVVAFCTARGKVFADVLTPDEHAGARLKPQEEVVLACNTVCEVSCETGAEDIGV